MFARSPPVIPADRARQHARGSTRSSRLLFPPRSARRLSRRHSVTVRRARLLAVVAAAAAASALLPLSRAVAQRRDAEPRRPRFTVVRDTNSAGAYYYHGLSVLDRDPQQAADAFYWASRLDPDWAEPYYARRVALLLTDRRRLRDYMAQESYSSKSPDFELVDSLEGQALIRNPFLYHRLDRVLIDGLFPPGAQPTDFDYAHAAGPGISAWYSYTQGRFGEALDKYALLLRRTPRAWPLHVARAEVFYLTTRYDSALVEMRTALDSLRRREDTKLMRRYESKALFEYSVGTINAAAGDVQGARDAYQRALVEDLSFYMAHVALAEVALAQHDTATAMTEYAQAVDLGGGQPGLHYRYGLVLFNAAKYDGAAEQFRRAIELDPYFAKPYYPLAYILEGTGKDAEAIADYEAFASRSPAAESTLVADARRRAAELRANSGGAPATPASPSR